MIASVVYPAGARVPGEAVPRPVEALDTYSHVMPGMQEDAAAKVAALLD